MDTERFDQIMRESDARWQKAVRESAERWEGEKRRSAERYEEFHGRMTARAERSEQHFIEALSENSAELARGRKEHETFTAQISESMREMRESMREMRESVQANTQAVLSVLDRMDRLDGT